MEKQRQLIRDWADMRHSEFLDLDLDHTVVLLTCSPLEVHGPHLPVATDIIEGDALLAATVTKIAVSRKNLAFIRLPDLFLAADVLPMRGSLAFSPKLVSLAIEELAASLAAEGFRHLWLSNFHGGPRHFLAMERAAHRAWKSHGIKVVSIFSLMVKELADNYSLASVLSGLVPQDLQNLDADIHAGLVETSMLLHLRPDLVDEGYRHLDDQSVWGKHEPKPGARDRVDSIWGMVTRFLGVFSYFYRFSYSGSPSLARAEIGSALIDRLASETAVRLFDLLDGRRSPADFHSHLWTLRILFLSNLTDKFLHVLDRRQRRKRGS